MIFNKNFTDFINLLEANNVRYVLVGGWRLMNGHFRTTNQDLDDVKKLEKILKKKNK